MFAVRPGCAHGELVRVLHGTPMMQCRHADIGEWERRFRVLGLQIIKNELRADAFEVRRRPMGSLRL